MKILIVTPDPDKSGGVANYYKTLSGSFSYDVDYFIMGSRTDKDGIVYDIKRLIIDYRGFVKKIKSVKYDLIVINPTLDAKSVLRDGRFIMLAKKHSMSKVIVFWRGFYLDFFDKYIMGRFRKVFSRIFFKADAQIVLGSVFKKKLESIGCISPVFCETTIVDDKFIIKKKREITSDRLNILFLARVEKDKGIYEAIQAYEIVKKTNAIARLTVAGNGFELEEAKKYVIKNKIEDVGFLGDIRGKDKIEAFENADVYLFPSYYEGMPNSVLEAMGMGLPVITRNVGGVPDFFVNGEMGYITDSFSPEVFAQCIKKLFANIELRKEMSDINTHFAKENFLKTIVLKRLENIFATVVFKNKN